MEQLYSFVFFNPSFPSKDKLKKQKDRREQPHTRNKRMIMKKKEGKETRTNMWLNIYIYYIYKINVSNIYI